MMSQLNCLQVKNSIEAAFMCHHRFGIELVSPVMPLPDHLHLEEVQELPLGEDFQWDTVDFDASCLPVSCEDPPPEDPYPEAPGLSAGQGNRDAGLQRLVEAFVKMEEDNWGRRDSQVQCLTVLIEMFIRVLCCGTLCVVSCLCLLRSIHYQSDILNEQCEYHYSNIFIVLYDSLFHCVLCCVVQKVEIFNRSSDC